MRIGVVGAGPAGLLFAYLVKCRRPSADVRVIEQNARDATFGFGVVFSHDALEFMARDAPTMHATLSTLLETWPIQRIVHHDTAVDIDGNGFSADPRPVSQHHPKRYRTRRHTRTSESAQHYSWFPRGCV